MAVLRDRPYPGMNFLVDLGDGNTDGPDAGVAGVVFPDARLQVNEYRTGNDRVKEVEKLLTLSHYGNLILRRGAIGSLSWYRWWDEVRNGGNAQRDIRIHLLDEQQTTTVLAWRFLRAKPVAYQYSPMQAQVADTLYETLELAFERLEME